MELIGWSSLQTIASVSVGGSGVLLLELWLIGKDGVSKNSLSAVLYFFLTTTILSFTCYVRWAASIKNL